MEMTRELNVPLPATPIAHELFGSLIALGRGDLDHSAIITIIDNLAGTEARTQRE